MVVKDYVTVIDTAHWVAVHKQEKWSNAKLLSICDIIIVDDVINV